MKTWNAAAAATLAIAGVMAVTASGCFKGEEDTCEYWTQQLEKSADIDRAMRKVSQLRCSAALPVLKKLYEDGQFQEAVLQTTKEIGDRAGAADILRMALRSTTQAKLAATIIADWKMKEMKEDLLKILTDDAMIGNREAALNALLAIEEPKSLEDALVKLADADANLQGVEVTARAIQELGKMRSEKAVPALLKAVYLRTNKGFEVYRDARRALAEIGTGVPEAALKVLTGDAPEVREFTRQIGVQDWETRFGPKTVQLLADSLDPMIAQPLAKNMAEDLAPPVGVSDKAMDQWTAGQRNRLKVAVFGIAQVGTDAAVEQLTAILKDKAMDTVNQRLNAATALAMIGTDAAQAALIDAYKTETSEAFKRPLLQYLALALDDAHLTEIEADIKAATDDVKAKRDEFDKALGELEAEVKSAEDAQKAELMQKLAYAKEDKAAFQMTLDKLDGYLWNGVRECKDNESCYLKKLKGDNQDQKVKALAMLARGRLGDRQRALDAAYEAFTGSAKEEVDTKRFALTVLTRLGDAKTGKRLLDLEGTLEEKDLFWRDELHCVGSYLSRRP
ncbi:MAG: hypothetical protein KC635_27155 [Myxococcales bacterium]|nr:hypothetical protein [Myxococcales bacterium]MCB9736741.1 hypothetical protein [Deltaproteobacteria bacterium]